jgi:hypothetical protein
MATVKKGVLTRTPGIVSCNKHLRRYGKRLFWKIERREAARVLRIETGR